MKKLKLEDVAALAGVSKTTVSRVINRRGSLSQKTIDKVEAAMAQLNYHPNVIAQQLHTQRTNLIGILVPSVANPFFGELTMYLEDALFQRGYKVLISDALNQTAKEERYLSQLMGHQVDGLIIATHNNKLEEYQHANLPIVAIDRFLRADIPVVASDNYAGAKLATEALIQRGCQHIIHTYTTNPSNWHDNQREKAFQAVMADHHLPAITYTTAFDCPPAERTARFERLFDEHPAVDGIFASNDLDAARLLSLARARGYRVPADLQIIGYDGAQATQELVPELATIIQPIEQMATSAVKLLADRMAGEFTPTSTVLPVNLKTGQTLKTLP